MASLTLAPSTDEWREGRAAIRTILLDGYGGTVPRTSILFEKFRGSFWLAPGLGIFLGMVMGTLLPAIDDQVDLPASIGSAADADTARSVLQTIGTVAVSVAGISFSVIVVALVLASQQLSPRVLRSFQRQPLNQAVLGLFLGTAAFSIFVLARIKSPGGDAVPDVSVALAMVLAVFSLALFALFLHHAVRSLNASTVIRRIAAEGQEAIAHRYPGTVGADAQLDEEGQKRQVSERTCREDEHEVRAPRAGYLVSVDGPAIMAAAQSADGFVEQRVEIGRFAVTDRVLAVIWCAAGGREQLANSVARAFVLEEERSVDSDIGFPLRQLADIALKGLSPGINDPTTAENAMDSAADTLVLLARRSTPTNLRLDKNGDPRFLAATPSFDSLVEIAFDQVRRDAANRPSFSVRLLELLADVRARAASCKASVCEIDRQATLICQASARLAEVEADHRLVEDTYEHLHGDVARAT